MTTLTTGKIAEVLYENVLETIQDQMMLVDMVSVETPDAGTMQNASNVIWRPVEQHVGLLDGWDLTGQEQGIIEETYPAVLGTPKNDWVELRADEMRDRVFWERRGQRAGRQQAVELNKAIANAISTQGALHYRSNAASGYDFVGEAQALMNEQQRSQGKRCFVLNDRDNLAFGSDLAARGTIQGLPADTWKTGHIAKQVAGFDDVVVGSFLPNVAGGADPATTVSWCAILCA